MTSTRHSRVLSLVVLWGLCAFLVLATLGALAYPGGTYCEPEADAYRFWGNFFCDLSGDFTRRRDQNVAGALLTRAAFASFALALGPCFWLIGGTASRGLGRAVRSFGATSACATAVLAWLPSVSSAEVHTVVALVAAIPGLLAMTLGTVALFAARRVGLAWLGVVTLGAGALNTAGYVWAVRHQIACLPWLPVVQKLAAIVLVLWMTGVALVFLRRETA
jgi:hypothetical protein